MLQGIDRALDVIYPRRCPVCDGPLDFFCLKNGKISGGELIHEKCKSGIRYVRGSTCMKCGKPMGRDVYGEYCEDCRRSSHQFTRGFSVFRYRSISGSIYKFKYMGRREYATFYGREAARLLGRKLGQLGIEALIPVPMYRDKERKRGYNQAEVFATALSRELGIPVYNKVIKRVRNTVPMKELDVSRRRNNLKKAFKVAENDVKFKCVLIIDDIYTTGSTIDEIAHEFRMVGTEEIYFLTLAIGQTT